MPGCSRSAPTVPPSPWSTLKTPAGSPASASSSASRRAADGSFSEGFKIIALPQASALAVIQSGTMTGKLNGVMPATTPTGWRSELTSTPFETWLEKPPLRWEPSPQANSMFSRPREISPSASAWTLPCSAVMIEAISSRRAWTRCRKENMTSVRADSEALPHDAAARRATAMVCSISASVAKGISAWT